jgi:hypothetical protein
MPTQHEHDDIEMLCGAVVALQVSVGGGDEAGGEVGVVGRVGRRGRTRWRHGQSESRTCKGSRLSTTACRVTRRLRV